MGHVILLGDSILDNGAYVAGGSPIITLLRSRLPREWRATLLARDGAVCEGVLKQLRELPADATHLVVSAGGNDALESAVFLNSPNPQSANILDEMVAVQTQFRSSYRQMISAIREARLPAIACTIYDAIPNLTPVERMALSMFNDVIVRELVDVRMPVLDLRFICNEPRDYSHVSPIEPSEIGGSKIARAIQGILLGHDFSRGETVVYR